MPRPNRGAYLDWREDRQVWQIVWYERGRRRSVSTGTGDRSRAERALADHISERLRPTSGPRDPSQRLIADALADYAAEHGPEMRQARGLAYAVERLALWWGERKVADIREATCRAYVRARMAGEIGGRRVSEATVRNELIYLGAAVRHDWEQGRLTLPVHVWTPPAADPRHRWLTREEFTRLLRAARAVEQARGHLPLFLVTALYLAARYEAVLTLRWSQVDLDRGTVDLHPGGKRTSKGRPRLPIPRQLLTILRCVRRRRGSDTGFVITYHGHPVTNIRASFARAVQLAGLPGKVTPHTLRHTAASWMAQNGVPMSTIAGYLGHSSERVTERVYAHQSPDYLDSARSALEGGPRRRRNVSMEQ